MGGQNSVLEAQCQKSGWNNIDSVIDHGEVRGRQFSDWRIEHLADDIKNFILSFLSRLPQILATPPGTLTLCSQDDCHC